jgi:biopolymer transport protein ExbB/TolQ
LNEAVNTSVHLGRAVNMDTPASILPHGLSVFQQIKNADAVVQGVMLLLAMSSLLCWTIGFEKLVRFIAFSRQVRDLERLVKRDSGDTSPLSSFVARLQSVAKQEPRREEQSLSDFQTALERSFQVEAATRLRQLQAGLPLLATVGSTAPFVGLFGTVWGIMNSFSGIATAKDTSIAVVAPGIAEALLATAIGLGAAIPAVVFYNLSNVFLSDRAERLSLAAGQYAKQLAYAENAVGQ